MIHWQSQKVILLAAHSFRILSGFFRDSVVDGFRNIWRLCCLRSGDSIGVFVRILSENGEIGTVSWKWIASRLPQATISHASFAYKQIMAARTSIWSINAFKTSENYRWYCCRCNWNEGAANAITAVCMATQLICIQFACYANRFLFLRRALSAFVNSKIKFITAHESSRCTQFSYGTLPCFLTRLFK